MNSFTLKKEVTPIKNQRKDRQAVRKEISSYSVEETIDLLPFLLKMITNKSRNSIKSLLTREQVQVDGKVITQHNHPLLPGQTVQIQSNKESLKRTALTGVTILHEDDDILVINKEAGILSVAANQPEEMTAYRQLTQYVKEENRKNRVFIVHRLDRDTSGVMVYAKTEAVKQTLQNNWKEVVEERKYTALVEGVVSEEEATISSWLTESKSMRVYSNPTDNGGKHAVTHYKKIQGNHHYSLLEVQLETGRKNQIRVHMQEIGHPVVGDKKYGATNNPLNRLGLHASTLSFLHPRTGKLVQYTALAPTVFYSKSK